MAGSDDAGKILYVSFSAEINANTTESLIAVLSTAVLDGRDGVYLMLSTPGGTVMHGLNLYNMIRAMPFSVVTHNVGNVDSIGNAIFLAGKPRYACQHSTFMFHGVGFDMNVGSRLEEKQCRETLDSILSDQSRIGSIIQEHTSMEEAQIRDLFREAQTKDSAFAASSGIVDEVRDVKIPAGAPVVSLVFQR